MYNMNNSKSDIGQELNNLCEYWEKLNRSESSLTEAGKQSLLGFMDKLPVERIEEAMCIATSKSTGSPSESQFKYFCGVCWNKIREAEGDTSIKIFNKARYYWRKHACSNYLREAELRGYSHIYSLEQIKCAMDIACSQRRSNYWNAVGEALEGVALD